MIDFPVITVDNDVRENLLSVYCSDEWNLDPILPIIDHKVFALTGTCDDMAASHCKSITILLFRFMWDFGFVNHFDKQIDIVKFVINCLGFEHTLDRFEPRKLTLMDEIIPMLVLGKCLTQHDGSLCNQLTSGPASTIDWLEEQLNDPLFSKAVDIYRNELMLEIAEIE